MSRKWFATVWRDPVVSGVVVVVLTSSGAIAFFKQAREWFFAEILIDRWQVFAWAVAAFVVGTALGYLHVRRRSRRHPAEQTLTSAEQPTEAAATPQVVPAVTQQAAAFKPFEVIDSKHQLEWQVVDDPAEWIDGRSSEWDREHIEGPFHSDPDCRAKLSSIYGHASNYSTTDPKCPRCGKLLFHGRPFVTISARSDVAEELRRMRRRGEAIAPGAILAHADYWSDIRPAK